MLAKSLHAQCSAFEFGDAIIRKNRGIGLPPAVAGSRTRAMTPNHDIDIGRELR
jgi:hypothetical protein